MPYHLLCWSIILIRRHNITNTGLLTTYNGAIALISLFHTLVKYDFKIYFRPYTYADRNLAPSRADIAQSILGLYTPFPRHYPTKVESRDKKGNYDCYTLASIIKLSLISLCTKYRQLPPRFLTPLPQPWATYKYFIFHNDIWPYLILRETYITYMLCSYVGYFPYILNSCSAFIYTCAIKILYIYIWSRLYATGQSLYG